MNTLNPRVLLKAHIIVVAILGAGCATPRGA